MTGTIKTIIDKKGFGFIRPDGGGRTGDIFFHASAVANDEFCLLHEGDRVEFEVVEGREMKSRAMNVRPSDTVG